MIIRSQYALLAAALLAESFSASAGVIDLALSGMPDNSWQKINVNQFEDVFTPPGLRPTIDSPYSNISAWSGAAWDSKRRDLLIYGGDIGNEQGNEVYIFHTETGMWDRGSLPSQIVTHNGITTTIGGSQDAPVSGETYDNLVYLKGADRLAVMAVSREAQTFRDETGQWTGPYFWDPSKANPLLVSGSDGTGVNPSTLGGHMWENRDNYNVPGRPNPAPGTNGSAEYANINGQDVVYYSDTFGNLWRYTVDPRGGAYDTWENVGRRPVSGQSPVGAGLFIPSRNLFVRAARSPTSLGGVLQVTSLDHPGPNNRALSVLLDPSLGISLPTSGALGMNYDPVNDQIVLWVGGEDLWLVDVDDLLSADDTSANNGGIFGLYGYFTPEHLFPSGDGPTIPAKYYTGVYGKWMYLEEEKAFIGVIDPFSGDVFLYKPAGAGAGGGGGNVPIPASSLLMTTALLLLLGTRRSIRKIGDIASSHASPFPFLSRSTINRTSAQKG